MILKSYRNRLEEPPNRKNGHLAIKSGNDSHRTISVSALPETKASEKAYPMRNSQSNQMKYPNI